MFPLCSHVMIFSCSHILTKFSWCSFDVPNELPFAFSCCSYNVHNKLPLAFYVVPTMFIINCPLQCSHVFFFFFFFVISQWLSYSHVVPFVILGHVIRLFINICEFNGMDFCVSQWAIVYLFYKKILLQNNTYSCTN